MNLAKYLSKHSPFCTKEDIKKLFKFLGLRNIHINDEIIERLNNSCAESVKTLLQECLVTYIENYKVRPRKTKRREINYSRFSENYYKSAYPESLAGQGYEYGLSDW